MSKNVYIFRIGYVCVDFAGEPAYDGLKGEWSCEREYVVVHRMAFSDSARGKGLVGGVFALLEELAREKNISYFRIDTDADNQKMQHILKKNAFLYCGTIEFDGSEKLAFDKEF